MKKKRSLDIKKRQSGNKKENYISPDGLILKLEYSRLRTFVNFYFCKMKTYT